MGLADTPVMSLYTMDIRFDVWSRALYCIRQAPVTGIGIGTFREVMLVSYPPQLGPPAVEMAHAHNVLLQTALDLGLVGMAVYAALWFLIARALIRTYRRTKVRVYRALAGGIGAGLLAHFSFNMTDAIALGAKPGILFWFAAALAVGLQQLGKADAGPRPPIPNVVGDTV